MRIGRTIPPAAAPISLTDTFYGIKGIARHQIEIERFRSELKEYYGTDYCYLVSSGKAALTIILKSLSRIYPGKDEVLIPGFTCYSVPSAVVRAGLKIRLCDVDAESLDFDYNLLKNDPGLINTKTLAILGVHLFGKPADIQRARSVSREFKIFIVEDAAQAMGGEVGGKKLGTLGDVGFFSFARGKALSLIEGGAIVTHRKDIAESINLEVKNIEKYRPAEIFWLVCNSLLLSVFQHPTFFWIPKGIKCLRVGATLYDPDFKIRMMSSFQAGLARNWRAKLKSFSNARQTATQEWHAITSSMVVNNYSSSDNSVPAFLRYPIKIESNQVWSTLLEKSEKEGLGIMFTYPDSIDGIKELSGQFKNCSCPVSRDLSRKILTIPVHPLLSSKDRNHLRTVLSTIDEDCKN